VDVLVELDGLATFDAHMDLKALLERVLGRRVDLVTQRALKPNVRSDVERDLIHVV
jgi:predicted nucleotidyltransferase